MRYGKGFRWSTAHNSFIQIGAELGVMGLVLLVLLFGDAFRLLARIRRRTSGEGAVLAQVFTACCLGFVVTALFLSQAYSAYLYSLLGMTLALSRISPSTAPVAAAARGTAQQPYFGPKRAFPIAGGLEAGGDRP